MVYMS